MCPLSSKPQEYLVQESGLFHSNLWERNRMRMGEALPAVPALLPRCSMHHLCWIFRRPWAGLQLPAPATTDNISHKASAPKTSWETKNESAISRAGDRLLPHTLSDFVLHHNLSACKQSAMLTQSLGGNVSLEICSLSQFQKGSES